MEVFPTTFKLFITGFIMDKRYNTLSAHLRERYGGKIGKICIDGGFSCPNRDGTCGVGGCIFCGERGAGEHIVPAAIDEQVRSYLASPRSAKYDGYIAYFQNFTNTYAAPDTLRERYTAALIDPRIRILAVGTRPDCIDEPRADVLAEFSTCVDSVFCELGLQTASDATAEYINRGWKTPRFAEAVETLHARGIEVIAHIIIGLPGEGERELYETIRLINSLPVSGVKIHSLYVMRGTRLCDIYERGEYTPISEAEYVRLAARSVSWLRPDIIIHRITGDCPRDLLAAPLWNTRKSEVIREIDEYLEVHGLYQGSECIT